jgi:dTDP-4-amino-4,6-dideoxygalactose transaminase
MIPRIKPYFNHKEIFAAFRAGHNAVEEFEKKAASKFKTKYGVAFLYGRSGLYALLKCMGIKDSEVIMPAYTCVVAANAVAYSGNIPRFVDISLDNYSMDLDLLEKALNNRTKAIIGTSLFGYPYDADRLKEIIKRSGREILLIQDCAHSLGAECNGRLLCNIGDAALFAFSINKEISSIYGGMIVTNSEEIYERLKKYRDGNFGAPSVSQKLKMLSLLLTSYTAFFNPFYGITNFLERNTAILDPITKYYKEDVIDMPKDFLDKLPAVNAGIGDIQLDKYDAIKDTHRAIAKLYSEELKNLKVIALPRMIEGATYLYCTLLINNRERFTKYMRKKGIQIGDYIPYAIPYMKAHKKYKIGDYPNSLLCSQNIINLPCHPSLSRNELSRIIRCTTDYFTDES